MARKEKNIHYIYKTTCDVTGKYYVGMHSTINEDDGYLGSGKRLRYSIRKYGADNHTKEILSYHETRELLIEAEIQAITDDMVLDKNCMNLKHGGEGGWNDIHHKAFKYKLDNDIEFREKILGILKNNNKNAHLNGNCCYDNFKDKSHSEETKQLMSEQRKGTGIGENNSQYGTCWITKEGVNKKVKKDELDSHLYDGWITGRK